MLTPTNKARADAYHADTLARIAAATEEARRRRQPANPGSGAPQA